MTHSTFGWALVLLGILAVVGRKWLSLGHLPGDFTFQRGSMTVLVPLGTSILVSIILSIVMAIFAKR